MSIRRHPSREGWWYIEYRPQGRKGPLKRIPFQGTELAAKQWEMEMRRETRRPAMCAELFPQLAQAAPDFVAEYSQEHLPLGVERTIRSLKHILAHFGNRKFNAVPEQLAAYKAKRLAAGVKHTTINKELAALSSFCRWAAGKGYCQEFKIKRFPPKLTKSRSPEVLSEDEISRFFGALKEDRRGYFALLYYAGMRASEARGLTASQVFLDRGVLVVRGKGNKERVIPIVDALRPILAEAMGHRPTGPLFPVPGDLRGCIHWASKRAGITKHVTPHTFRHCFGTHATMAGVSLRSLQEIMGHSSSAVTEIYSRLGAQALTTELAKFGERITNNQADKH